MISLYINRRYNNYLAKKGLPYYSLSKFVKKSVKQTVSIVAAGNTFSPNLANCHFANCKLDYNLLKNHHLSR